jgi:trk system potassium uptake protein
VYIIVVGGGKVGFHLAKELVDANHEVLVIELDSTRAKEIGDELGDIVMDGDGCEATVLDKAGAGRADMMLGRRWREPGDVPGGAPALQHRSHRGAHQ